VTVLGAILVDVAGACSPHVNVRIFDKGCPGAGGADFEHQAVPQGTVKITRPLRQRTGLAGYFIARADISRPRHGKAALLRQVARFRKHFSRQTEEPHRSGSPNPASGRGSKPTTSSTGSRFMRMACSTKSGSHFRLKTCAISSRVTRPLSSRGRSGSTTGSAPINSSSITCKASSRLDWGAMLGNCGRARS
jgi:hypothetical protein